VTKPSDARIYESRAVVYGAMTRLYLAPPEPEILIDVERTGFLQLMLEVGGEEAGVGSLLVDSDELSAEFTRLFLGPGHHVSPHASVYRKDEPQSGELWGHSTGEVKRFMEHYGLTLHQSAIIPDHIAVLFEFMQQVQMKVHELMTSDRPESETKVEIDLAVQVERDFFNNYISGWIDSFLDAVEKANPCLFYAVLARFTRLFMANERSDLSPDSCTHGSTN